MAKMTKVETLLSAEEMEIIKEPRGTRRGRAPLQGEGKRLPTERKTN
jgi:hypothetical protein